MILTTGEFNLLATRHANSYEAAQLRNRLLLENVHFCSICKSTKEVDILHAAGNSRAITAAIFEAQPTPAAVEAAISALV